jgi:hypothetical protein
MRFVLLTMAVCLFASSAAAARLTKGNTVLWLGLNGNDAQLLNPSGGPLSEGELGLHVALNHFLSDAWTIVLSGGFDAGRLKLEPVGGGEDKLSSTSFNVRLGGDRYAFINDDVALYAGPGILFWKGHGKFQAPPGPDQTWPDVTQIGLNGRIGMYARLASHAALFGHIGQVIATNSGDDSGDKWTWWTNHHEGTVGLAFDF